MGTLAQCLTDEQREAIARLAHQFVLAKTVTDPAPTHIQLSPDDAREILKAIGTLSTTATEGGVQQHAEPDPAHLLGREQGGEDH